MRKKTRNKRKRSAHKTKSPKFAIYPNPNFFLPTSFLWVDIDVSARKNPTGSYFTQFRNGNRKKVKSKG